MTSLIQAAKRAVKVPGSDEECLADIDVWTAKVGVFHIVVDNIMSHNEYGIIHEVVVIEMLAVMQLEECIAGVAEIVK